MLSVAPDVYLLKDERVSMTVWLKHLVCLTRCFPSNGEGQHQANRLKILKCLTIRSTLKVLSKSSMRESPKSTPPAVSPSSNFNGLCMVKTRVKWVSNEQKFSLSSCCKHFALFQSNIAVSSAKDLPVFLRQKRLPLLVAFSFLSQWLICHPVLGWNPSPPPISWVNKTFNPHFPKLVGPLCSTLKALSLIIQKRI